jgi:Leucine-rich repeat (LRR) protein
MKYVLRISLLFLCINSPFAEGKIFKDPELEKSIEDKIGTPITLNNLSDIRVFEDYGGNITSLAGIGNMANLQELTISDNDVKNIEPLRELSNLRILGLWGNDIKDITVLKYLSNLERVYLNDNSIRDISSLCNLKELKKLTLQRNPLSDKSYEVFIPRIKKNNPGIVIYHDRTLTPEKSLYYARMIFLGAIVVVALLFFFKILRKRLKVSTES